MLKHFESGDPEPTLDQSQLIFYLFQFCPFSRRVALVLSHHAIKHERIYIDIAKKPNWFLTINPTGKVPMIVQDSQKLLDSQLICRYLDQLIDGDSLISECGEGRIELVNDWWNKIFKAFHAIAFEHDFTQEHEKVYLDSLGDFEKMLQSSFLSGTNVGLADFLVYSIMELSDICLSRIKHPLLVNHSDYPRTNLWFQLMNGIPAVQREKIDEETHKFYLNSILKIPTND